MFVPIIIIILIVLGVVVFFTNRNNNKNNMDENQIKPRRVGAKDFFLNLGAFISLYVLIGSVLNLLFSVIDKAYPQINSYGYGDSATISWPVSILVVFFPIFILLMWFLERQSIPGSEEQPSVIHRGLTYITLFVSGLTIAGDLITVVYYFIDGKELTAGFLMKVLVLFIIASCVFLYFITDLRNKLTKQSRIIWRIISGFLILGSVVWGFAVLGSPRTQRLLKYDEQKISDLQNIKRQIENFYFSKKVLPATLDSAYGTDYGYSSRITDKQTSKLYEYIKINDLEYQLCAEFNKDSNDKNRITSSSSYYGGNFRMHPAGHYCFKESVVSLKPEPYPSYPQSYPQY